jgi:hypothetical protein
MNYQFTSSIRYNITRTKKSIRYAKENHREKRERRRERKKCRRRDIEREGEIKRERERGEKDREVKGIEM